MKDRLLLRLLHRRCVADRWFFELKITQVPFRRLILANILLLIRLERIRKLYTLYLSSFLLLFVVFARSCVHRSSQKNQFNFPARLIVRELTSERKLAESCGGASE